MSSVFQENFIKIFKGVSRSFVLQFFCSINLIAATRAEGGLVSIKVMFTPACCIILMVIPVIQQ